MPESCTVYCKHPSWPIALKAAKDMFKDVKIAMAWHIITVNGVDYIFHNGGTNGSSSFLAFNAEKNLAIFFEVGERRFIAIIVAVAVGDGNLEDLAFLRGVGEGGVGVFHTDVDVAADEAEAGVAHHGAGE